MTGDAVGIALAMLFIGVLIVKTLEDGFKNIGGRIDNLSRLTAEHTESTKRLERDRRERPD